MNRRPMQEPPSVRRLMSAAWCPQSLLADSYVAAGTRPMAPALHQRRGWWPQDPWIALALLTVGPIGLLVLALSM
jgi:hypothetical protein